MYHLHKFTINLSQTTNYYSQHDSLIQNQRTLFCYGVTTSNNKTLKEKINFF